MPDGVVGIAILSSLTGAALNSMASGLVSDTNAGQHFLFQKLCEPGAISLEISI